jgi:hypothetical protein
VPRFFLAAGVALVASTLFVAPATSEPARPECVHVNAYARYGAYGYDHIVDVSNGCEHPAVCDVRTNVNPDPMTVRVEPGARESVVTFRGSPAREFAAQVRCKLEQ